jgi:hypothetical protein
MKDRSTRNRIVSLADLAAQAPSVYRLLDQVGRVRRRRRATRVARSAGWFGAGVAVGGGLATLLAPNNGREMRRRLSSRARRVREYLAPGDRAAEDEEAS